LVGGDVSFDNKEDLSKDFSFNWTVQLND